MSDLLLTPDEIRAAARQLGETLASYETKLRNLPVFPDLDRNLLRRILDEPLPEAPRPVEDLFREFCDELIPNSTQIPHPRFLAYVLSSPHGLAPFAEALASALNQNCNVWMLSPVANAIEQKVISWFLELFGTPSTGGGIMTSGGSMANLIGLAVARDTYLGSEAARNEGLQSSGRPLVLYTSEEVHYSIDKAVAMLGLGLNYLRRIPTDDHFRIRVDLLQAAVHRDRRNELRPFCVIGTAGAVATGAIDPLADLVDFCGAEGLWLHVDGAYGAFAVLSEQLRPELLPAGQADSLALDPHKLLFNSLEAGCVIFKDVERLRATFRFEPSYIGLPEDPDLTNLTEYGPQLSRSFKAFKVWWALRAFGRETYASAIEEVLSLASYMAERIQQEPNLQLVAPVNLTAVCLRHAHLSDSQNERLLERLVQGGQAYLGPARVRDRFCLRACFTNLRTTRDDVDLVLDEVLRLANGSVS